MRVLGKTIALWAMLCCLVNGHMLSAQQMEHPNGLLVTRMGEPAAQSSDQIIFDLKDPLPGIYIAQREELVSRSDGFISGHPPLDTLTFEYKNLSGYRQAQMRLSISSTGLDPESFSELKIIDLDRSQEAEWTKVHVVPDTVHQKKVFIKWELIIDGVLIQDGRTGVRDSFADKFLRYELMDFSVFEPILHSNEEVHDQLEIAFNGVTYDVYLEKVELRAEGYSVQLWDGKDLVRYQPTQETKMYTGINKSTGGQIRLTLSENFAYGFVETGSETYYIEPAVFYDRAQNTRSMLVYSNRDVANYPDKTCAFDDRIHSGKSPFSSHGHQKNSPNCGIVEYAIACDYSMFEKYGSVQNLINRNLGVMNNVQSNYIGWFSRNYIFEIGEQFLVTCAGCDPWTSSTNSSTLLNSFSNWAGNGFSVNHDVASLWTDRNFDGSTIGVAWVGAICASQYKYNINQDFSANAEFIRVLLAHELGHNFGSSHDASGAPHIMAPAVSANTTWSTQSQSQINSYMNGTSCIAGCPPLVGPQCGGRFYDTGGADQPYSNNQDYTVTICPDGNTDYVSILFNFFKTEAGADVLTCYQGEDTNGAILWSHSGLNLPPINPAVSTHPSGCLTFRFVSNGTNTQEGWAASIDCFAGDYCAPPTSPQVTSITETSAVLSWTAQGGATAWDIELVNFGSAPTGVPSHSNVTNPYTVSGLTLGTQYSYYVRSRCTGSNFSDWVGPNSFITTSPGVPNDFCSNAFLLTVNTLEQCPSQSVNGTTLDANASISSACSSNDGPFPDTWYTFNTGNFSGFNFKINAAQGVHVGMQLFVSCGGSQVFCTPNVTNYNTNITGFPQNTTIRVRIFTDLSIGQTGTFNICISAIPPPPNDLCSGAISLTPTTTCTNVSGSTTLANFSGIPATCDGYDAGTPRDVWYQFEADGFHEYTITMNMTVDGVLILYKGSCGSLIYENCADNNFGSGIEQIQAGLLDAGTYYVRLYGFASAGNFTICVTQTEAFGIASGVMNNCTEYELQNGGGTWVTIDDQSGNIIASVNLNGHNGAPSFTPTLFVTNALREDSNGQRYVGRDISIASSENNFPSPVTLRLFYTTSEIDALIASDDGVMSLSDINITKTSVNCQGNFTGQGEFFQQTGSGVFGGGYYIDIEVNSFSTFYAHGGFQALPVSLLSFEGEPQSNGNAIRWTVEQEDQLSHYEIQRSKDAKEFDVLKVEAAKAADQRKHTYTYLDRNPLPEGYYRLISVDLNGSTSISQTIWIKRDQSLPITVYPNPVKNTLFISGQSASNIPYSILDMNGRILDTGLLDHQAGIDVQFLESGVYLLKTQVGDQQDFTRFVKMD